MTSSSSIDGGGRGEKLLVFLSRFCFLLSFFFKNNKLFMFWGVRNPDVTFILGGGKCRGHTRAANYCFGRLNTLLRGAFMLFPLPTRSTLEK